MALIVRSKLFTPQSVYFGASRFLSTTTSQDKLKSSYDAVIIGAGLSVAVLERRHVVGGASVTEEIIPGFKFSRASYLLSLLRPSIWKDLQLDNYGIKFHFRDPYSYTPLLAKQNGHSSLTLGKNDALNAKEIAKFSRDDAENFIKYEEFLTKVVSVLEPIFFDMEPLDVERLMHGSLSIRWKEAMKLRQIFKLYSKNLGRDITFVDIYELLTAPISKVLGYWFESEVLKASLATDGMIGAMLGVNSPGSGYVLLHHVMGGAGGRKGCWAYVEGGMGAFTGKLAQVATDRGVHIFTNQTIKSVEISNGRATGVVTQSGQVINAKAVLSNATPKVTYLDLIDKKFLPQQFRKRVEGISYESGVAKINIAAKALPNFTVDPSSPSSDSLMPHHQTTAHLNSETLEQLQNAYTDALMGKASSRPLIEMTIQSALDPTLAPKGCHVIQLFTQFAPYNMPQGFTREDYAQRCFDQIEEYAPGFKSNIIGHEVLCPADIEREFGLTGGNIFHGEMSLDQLYFSRIPVRSPVKGMYLCGSGTHPGGGVMGTPGVFAANAVMDDKRKKLL